MEILFPSVVVNGGLFVILSYLVFIVYICHDCKINQQINKGGALIVLSWLHCGFFEPPADALGAWAQPYFAFRDQLRRMNCSIHWKPNN